MMDGDRSILGLGADTDTLRGVFRDSVVVGDIDEFCAIPSDTGEVNLDSRPCSAGHTTCYVSPYGDVFPACSFPLRPAMYGASASSISGAIRVR